MATRTRFRVEGLQQLGEAMRELGADMAGKIARAATNAAAQTVKKAAQNRAPVATGNLKRNIIVKRLRKSETKLSSEHIVTVRKGRLTTKQKQAGLQDAYYASFVEYGTVHAPAQPFLRPGFEAAKKSALDAAVARMKQRIDKAQRGGK